MDFVKAILIVVACVFSLSMTHHVMFIPPFFQSIVDPILLGVDAGVRSDGLPNNRFDGFLLPIFQHPNRHFAPPLDQAEDRWLLPG